jgi:hypothetical protein
MSRKGGSFVMFALQMPRHINIILTLALLIAPGTHTILSATVLPGSVAISSAAPEANPSLSRCGHASHEAQCVMSSWAAVVGAAPALAIPAREPPWADFAADPISSHLLAATARGPPSA